MAYTSRLLNAIPGIRHAFLDVHETAAFTYAELAPVKLVHGNEVHHYQQPLPTRPHADAVFTAVAGQKVGVVTADCLPLLIASRDGRYVCSVHAGRQGLVSGIVDNSLACFRQQGVALADLVIAVGPYIHPCCYEVSAGFYQQLLDQPGGDRVARHRQRLFHSRSGPVSDPLKAAARGSDNLWFDLRAFAEAIFAEAGVAPASVEWLGSCTYCTPQSLGSYRRRTHFPAPKSFQYSWIMREA
ncbi:TPA: polyphenol oxidase family protein [Klebsiella pneumoniae]